MKLIFLLLLLPALYAHGQPCDPAIHPDNDRYGYKPRDGRRCEGTFTKFRSGDLLSIASFTSGLIRYNMNDSSTLQITTPETPFHAGMVVQGINHSMSTNISYRLDIPMAEKSVETLPLGAVVIPLKIHPENLGLYGYIIRDNRKIYLPVRSNPSNAKPSHGSRAPEQYLASFVPSEPFAEIGWRLTKKGEQAALSQQPYTKVQSEISRDNAFTIDITDVAKQLGTVECTLYIRTVDANKNRNMASFDLYIPASF